MTVGRFHGGAYVVFNKALNPNLRMIALADTKVSVIGGSAAAEVVLGRQVRDRMAERRADGSAEDLTDEALRREVRAEVATRFDQVHSVERAFQTNSVDEVIQPNMLRPTVAAYLRAGARVVPEKLVVESGH